MSNLPLYLSAPSACAYRPDQLSRTMFVDPRRSLNANQRETLSALGFRRSGPTYYRPCCPQCSACESARVAVNEFQANRQQRRCWQRNQDLIASWSAAQATEERYVLYQRYLRARHADGDMDPDDAEGFERFLCSPDNAPTQHLLFRDTQGQLLAVAVVDRLLSGLSAVYSFFDPDQPARSLGRYVILRLIDACRAAHLPWLYLGYYIADCDKMRYKAEYQPQQRFIADGWHPAED